MDEDILETKDTDVDEVTLYSISIRITFCLLCDMIVLITLTLSILCCQDLRKWELQFRSSLSQGFSNHKTETVDADIKHQDLENTSNENQIDTIKKETKSGQASQAHSGFSPLRLDSLDAFSMLDDLELPAEPEQNEQTAKVEHANLGASS